MSQYDLTPAGEAAVRLALKSAQLRTQLAEAWDEGYDAGDQAARAVNPEWPETPRNPYRGADG